MALFALSSSACDDFPELFVHNLSGQPIRIELDGERLLPYGLGGPQWLQPGGAATFLTGSPIPAVWPKPLYVQGLDRSVLCKQDLTLEQAQRGRIVLRVRSDGCAIDR